MSRIDFRPPGEWRDHGRRPFPQGRRPPLESCVASAANPPLLRRDCPSFVIAPTSANLQIAWRKPFESKACSFNQCARCCVARLNVRLQTMQTLPGKYFSQNGIETSLHVAVAMVWCERVIAEVGRTETAANDLADVDDAREFAASRTHEVAELRLQPEALKIQIEAVGCGGRIDPRIVQPSTSLHRGKKFFATFR